MRIALIDPQGITRGLNVGLGILAAQLKKAGCDCTVIDLNSDPENGRSRVQRVRGFDAIGISVKSFTVQSAREIAQSIGRHDIICGGPHITLDGEAFLACDDAFRFGVVGEAEESLVELVSALQQHTRDADIKGVLFRRDGAGGGVRFSGPRQAPADLDALPLPDYSVFDSVDRQIFDYPVLTSRGCPFSCIYCCVGRISGRHMRYRSIDRVVEEIEKARSDYRARNFHILDDNFTIDIARAKRFCSLLIKQKLRMDWSCPNGIRADCLDEELVSLMKDSGLRQVSIGIESLDEEVFGSIQKGERLADITRAVELFNRYRIKVTGFFIIGLPLDTVRRSLASLRKSSDLGLYTALWNLFVPYPGTKAWEWANTQAKILQDWRQGFHFGPRPVVTFETRDFTKEEKLSVYTIANIKSRNYLAFFSREEPLVRNMARVFWLILRYDAGRILAHAFFICRNLFRARRYV